jgi:uridine phosphorylase
METAGIYLLAGLLGHQTISLNAILANRRTGDFSGQPSKTVELLIERFFEVYG